MNTSVIDISKVSERRESAPISEGHALISVIERAARDPNVDVTKMERLFAMRKEIAQEMAEREFNAAMNACQAEMRHIATDAENQQTRSRYATYAALDRQLRPIYTKHGFAISYDEAESQKPDHLRVLAYVSHAGGFTRVYRTDMAVSTKGPKGGDLAMTLIQAEGSSKSYGMRYLLRGIFNIAIGEDDKDGNDEATITEKQAEELKALITEGGGDLSKALRFMRVNSLMDIPAKNFDTVVKDIKAVNKARAKGGAK